MTDKFQSLFDEIQLWAENAATAGWINSQDVQKLKETQEVQIEQLFKEHGHRPLIVAFFGGTGVGKSTLLNRLSGENIARVGVARPTSMEVTLYLHESFEKELLPDELPTQDTNIAYHAQENRRLVAWLDLPDFDSTEGHNKTLVQAWLPYIDWMIYVVSPDRYHDEMGWRYVQERAHRHAWLFVMNHWDEGKPEQIDDLRNRLMGAGFSKPVILRSVCTDGDYEDDFSQLEQTINNSIHEYGLSVLQELGLQAHIEDVAAQLQSFQKNIGDPERWQTLHTEWTTTTHKGLGTLSEQLVRNANTIHQNMRAQESTPALPFQKSTTAEELLTPSTLTKSTWSPRNQMRIEDLCTRLVNQIQSSGLPFQPLKNRLDALKTVAKETIELNLEEHLAVALTQPGTPLQRTLYRHSKSLTWALPLLAALWASFHLVAGFYSSTQGNKAFLGLDFAIHTVLLIGLAWLIPWLIHRKLKPSVADATKHGLSQGNAMGIAELKKQFKALWNDNAVERKNLEQEIKKMQEKLNDYQTSALEQLEGYVGKAG
ncbi:MAG: hypothetical protein DSZ28_07895 [Thiothrix sp.]|nr:MAG: hypothetical protein DSZ28_07895 [Thiothrix sp.]